MGGPDATTPDFAAMYRELGLDANCSVEALRIARRRRIARLHPDLGGIEADTGRLQRLNRAYAAAIAFHARFGRLPGAPAPGMAIAPTPAPPQPATEPAFFDTGAAPRWRRADLPPESRPTAGLGTMSRSPKAARALIAIAVAAMVAGLAVALVVAVLRSIADDAPVAATTAAGAAAPATVVPHPGTLARGMDRDTVRKTLGEPLDMHALRWHYGPSWVDFRCDRVAGWYSAPQRPLPVSGSAFEAPSGDGCD